MYFLSYILHVCYFSFLIRLMNGYLLFAANLEDFNAIAKKLAPETLGESFARIAAKPYLREKLEEADIDNTEEASSENDNKSLPPIKGKKEKHPPLKGNKDKEKPKEVFHIGQGTKVDFDELVERVKKRLTMELKHSYLSNIRKDFNKEREQNNEKLLKVDNYNNYNKKFSMHNTKQNPKKQVDFAEKSKYVKDRFNLEEMSPFADTPDYNEDRYRFYKPKAKQGIKNKKTIIDEDDYEDAVKMPFKYPNSAQKDGRILNPKSKNRKPSKYKKNLDEIQSTTNPSAFYDKMELPQNDSYEDYVTPAKENVYASSEKKHSYIKDDNKQKYIPNNKRYKIEASANKNFDNNHATVKSHVEINENARDIEMLPNNYDYTDKKVESEEIKAKTEKLWYDNNEKVTTESVILSETVQEHKYGTNLPTRHVSRMVTPNFLADFPVVVEKYNFHEPIPERDREREILKYIGNPPASINKKVRLV